MAQERIATNSNGSGGAEDGANPNLTEKRMATKKPNPPKPMPMKPGKMPKKGC